MLGLPYQEYIEEVDVRVLKVEVLLILLLFCMPCVLIMGECSVDVHIEVM